jgi:hypothetical protein
MLHPFISDAAMNLARHELGHGFLAHSLCYYVHGIELDDNEGRTEVSYPLEPAQFAQRFAESPLSAALAAVRVIACVRAGSFCEVWGGIFGAEPSGRDLERIELWRSAVLPFFGQDGWVRIYSEAFRGLSEWYRHGSVRDTLATLAPWVVAQRSVSRFQLLSAFEVSGACHWPDPTFQPVLPPARRQPTPAPASSRPSQRRVEAPAEPRSSQGEGSLLREDARYRFYGLDGAGDANIFRRESKATGESRYLVSEVIGQGRDGKQHLKWHEFGSVSGARGELARLARP